MTGESEERRNTVKRPGRPDDGRISGETEYGETAGQTG